MPATEHTKHARRQHKEDYRKCISPVQHDGDLTKSPESCESLSLIPTVLDAHRRDVFSAYPIPMRGTSLEALDEHLQVLHTEELVLEITGGAQHPVLTSLFPRSLQDPCLFTCFLAATQSIYEQRRSSGRFEPSDLLLNIKAKALGSIRDRIMSAGDGQDDNLIAGVVELMVADSVCGNIQSLISHQRGARKLITLRKGDVSDPLLKTMLGVLVVIEFYMALVQFLSPQPTTPPAAENPLRYLKHPFPASLCVRISTLPSGLEDLVLRSNLSLQTIGLLEAVNSWSTAIQELPSDSSTADASYRRLFAEPMDSSRSAIFILRHLRQSQAAQFSIEYVLCLGIVIIIKHQRSTRKTDHIDDGLLQVFTQHVKQFARPAEIESETIVWLVTAVAWRVHAMFPVHADDLVDHVIRTHGGSRDIHAVQKIWSRFLWSEQFGAPWTRLWQTGLDRLQQHQQQRQVTRSLSTEDGKNHHQQQQQQQFPQPEQAAEDCVFSRGFVHIKKEDSNESAYSLSSLNTLSRSWTQSENSTRGSSQSNERGG